MRLKDKVTIITGGGTGIGAALSRTFLKEGARVVIGSRDPNHYKAFAEGLAKEGWPILGLELDITRKESVDRFVAQAVQQFGPITILVNNAGASGQNPIDKEGDERWMRILQTNLTGTYYVTKRVLKEMRDQSHGRIINLSSVLGRFGVSGYTAYCAAKHGIIGFTRALALEVVSRGITVNALCPGWVETEMARLGLREWADAAGLTEEEVRRQAVAAVPMKRFTEDSEVAELAVYLASDASQAMTGQALNICGGATMS
ncbi:MAG: SDR family oxidoreductase [Candidatus Manganitrophaceae bacterium]|nr:MAG: SDR family oxidoreductase [Candidatus Manganitrophaceae bacterium]